MWDVTTTFFKFKVWITTVLLCLELVTGVAAQTPGPVVALEASNVKLAFPIPNTNLANVAHYIVLKLDRGPGQDVAEVAFLMPDGPRVKEVYSGRLTVTHTNRLVEIVARNVSTADAGTIRCFVESRDRIIPNCGQLLIISRKPNRPTVHILQPMSLEGSDLHVVCEANSASLPSNHGLKSELFWFDSNGDSINPSLTNHRIHVNTENQLVIEGLRRADHGSKFTCISADITGDRSTRILSDHSQAFEVITEYRPVQGDLRLAPDFEAHEIVRKVIGEKIAYRCGAACVPSCRLVWLYSPYGSTAGFREVLTLVDKEVLAFVVSRTNEGSYRCLAENTHGSVYRELYLEALYMSNPSVHINGEEVASVRVLEGSPVDLMCLFDSNPVPVVRWSSPAKTVLFTEEAAGPQERLAHNGLHVRSYASNFSLAETRCEDSGVYRCDGRNSISFGEGRIHVFVLCPPTRAGVPGLELLPEYIWDLSQPIQVSFVIRSLPEPDIGRIMSAVRGQTRKELIPRDFAVSTSRNYDGKHFLTKFTLSNRRTLDMSDSDRVFTLSIESSEFTKDFAFMIRPRGPPRPVTNLTATDVSHDSLSLSWLPSFNGGEIQTFFVEFHLVIRGELPEGSEQIKNGSEQLQGGPEQLQGGPEQLQGGPEQLQGGPEQLQEGYEQPEVGKWWTSVRGNISDPPGNKWASVQVRALRSNSDYVFRVTARNKLGTSFTELQVKTAEPPEKSLGGGAIAGIVICAIIFVALLIACLYIFVCKKWWDKGADDESVTDDEEHIEVRKSMIPESSITSGKRDDCNNVEEATELSVSGRKQSCWFKVRRFLKMKRRRRHSSTSTGTSKSFKDFADDDDLKDVSDTEDLSNTPILTPPVEAEADPSPILTPPVEAEAEPSPTLTPPVEAEAEPSPTFTPPVEAEAEPSPTLTPPVEAEAEPSPKPTLTPPVEAEPSPKPIITPPVEPEPSPKPIITPPVEAEPSPKPIITPPVEAEPSPKPIITPPVEAEAEPSPKPIITPPVEAEPSPKPIITPPVEAEAEPSPKPIITPPVEAEAEPSPKPTLTPPVEAEAEPSPKPIITPPVEAEVNISHKPIIRPPQEANA